jgi:ferredoxin-type protein NapH
MNTPRFLSRHLNKLRWITLSLVFALLILLPFISIYQNFVAAHAYDFLAPQEKELYDTVEWITAPFVHNDPAKELNAIKGTTWSGTFFGLQLSDPLAVVGQIAARMELYWPFILTAFIPILFTAVLGRFYCGWLCPATFLFELNDMLGQLLRKAGFPVGGRRFNLRFKYVVLGVGILLSSVLGSVVFAAIYPPAIIGRELYYMVALSGAGVGTVFFAMLLLLDLFVSRRGFCRYICPGGALYSLLGRFRLLRIQRTVHQCNDCTLCDRACPFGLNPMGDDFGQECNNCTACMAVCPTDALHFRLRPTDVPPQGHGHLSPQYKKSQAAQAAQGGEA